MQFQYDKVARESNGKLAILDVCTSHKLTRVVEDKAATQREALGLQKLALRPQHRGYCVCFSSTEVKKPPSGVTKTEMVAASSLPTLPAKCKAFRYPSESQLLTHKVQLKVAVEWDSSHV